MQHCTLVSLAFLSKAESMYSWSPSKSLGSLRESADELLTPSPTGTQAIESLDRGGNGSIGRQASTRCHIEGCCGPNPETGQLNVENIREVTP